MMNNPEIGQYVIFSDPNKKSKKCLVYVTNIDLEENKFKAIIEDSRPFLKEEYWFDSKDILLNLGREPIIGTVYGVKVEAFLSKVSTNFGDVIFYDGSDTSEIDFVKESLNKCYERIKEIDILPIKSFGIEFRKPRGSTIGCYINTKGEKDLITFTLKDYSMLDEVMFHEYGHGVWFSLINKELVSKWYNLYYSNVYLEDITDLDLQLILDNINSKFKFKKGFEPEDRDKRILKIIMSYVRYTTRLNLNQLTVLVENENIIVNDIWPTSVTKLCNMEETITNYANKNPYEYFAETFMMYCLSQNIPENVFLLLEETLDSIKNHS